jgi:1-deoxy-D-xylulose-5-phosphate reductoisomerase
MVLSANAHSARIARKGSSETRGNLRAERPCRLSVLGATGSIGRNTLDLVDRNPMLFDVVAVTAHSNVTELAALAVKHRARYAAIGDAARESDLRDALSGTGIEVLGGPDALVEAARVPADCIMAAIVGAAGLKPTFAAAAQGSRLALANKECLVSAGEVFIREIGLHGTELLPVDSEHSAAFQALAGSDPSTVEKIVLTASGGPFRTWTRSEIEAATPEKALKHPNWSMGAKITIDSATLMNKGLELIEAYHLFPVGADALDCVVHPQSIVHCLVSYKDGSVLAQLAAPDMRTPIAVALAWPGRMSAPTEKLDLARLGTLTFEDPDETRFPALPLAKAALKRGKSAPAVLNAANEIAVAAFLDKRLKFMGIPALVGATVEAAEKRGLIASANCLDDVLNVDAGARKLALELLAGY